MEKIELNSKQFGKEKATPVVFGLTKENIYSYTKHCMTIMCRESGQIVKKMEKFNEKSIFILDSQSNLIEFCAAF